MKRTPAETNAIIKRNKRDGLLCACNAVMVPYDAPRERLVSGVLHGYDHCEPQNTTRDHLKTLQTIKARLRAGDTPWDIGQHFDGGSQRRAYQVGPFVVKASDTVPCSNPACDRDCWACRIAAGVGLPVRKAPTVRVQGPNDGPWYDVQLRYEALSPVNGALKWHDSPQYRDSQHFDLHARNVGLDRRGRYVAFDW